MSDSDFLSRCSSYEADVDSDSEISTSSFSSCSYSESEEEIDNGFGRAVESKKQTKKLERKKSNVLLEGYVVDSAVNDDLKRTKSLTDDDLEELKGCVDLGFGFNYEEIPELCNTLPALELCYSMSQKFMDQDHHHPSSSPEKKSSVLDSPVSPIASWKISSPGDNPDDVKARLIEILGTSCGMYCEIMHLTKSFGFDQSIVEESMEKTEDDEQQNLQE